VALEFNLASCETGTAGSFNEVSAVAAMKMDYSASYQVKHTWSYSSSLPQCFRDLVLS